jgi:putative Holliday junction resolvase
LSREIGPLTAAYLTSAMALCNPEDLARLVPAGARLMGLDLGEKTIGVALCDPGRRLATPLETLRRGRFAADAARLAALAGAHGVGGIVLGLPLNMDGGAGPRAQATRAFARNLLARLHLPLALWDERLSTVAVERAMIDADVSRAARARRVDAAAAAWILQGALDFLARRPPG